MSDLYLHANLGADSYEDIYQVFDRRDGSVVANGGSVSDTLKQLQDYRIPLVHINELFPPQPSSSIDDEDDDTLADSEAKLREFAIRVRDHFTQMKALIEKDLIAAAMNHDIPRYEQIYQNFIKASEIVADAQGALS